MTLNDRSDTDAREEQLDAAAGRGLSSFVSFLKRAAREVKRHRTDPRREIDAA